MKFVARLSVSQRVKCRVGSSSIECRSQWRQNVIALLFLLFHCSRNKKITTQKHKPKEYIYISENLRIVEYVQSSFPSRGPQWNKCVHLCVRSWAIGILHAMQEGNRLNRMKLTQLALINSKPNISITLHFPNDVFHFIGFVEDNNKKVCARCFFFSSPVLSFVLGSSLWKHAKRSETFYGTLVRSLLRMYLSFLLDRFVECDIFNIRYMLLVRISSSCAINSIAWRKALNCSLARFDNETQKKN